MSILRASLKGTGNQNSRYEQFHLLHLIGQNLREWLNSRLIWLVTKVQYKTWSYLIPMFTSFALGNELVWNGQHVTSIPEVGERTRAFHLCLSAFHVKFRTGRQVSGFSRPWSYGRMTLHFDWSNFHLQSTDDPLSWMCLTCYHSTITTFTHSFRSILWTCIQQVRDMRGGGGMNCEQSCVRNVISTWSMLYRKQL